MFPKTQDDTIDRLLRAQGGAAGKELPPCRQFDADLANAYVERSLQASQQASYENHLAACSPCRKAIVALTRMAQAEHASARGVAATGQARGTSPIRQWLGALTVPQWAMAAAAVVVLAITLPLVLSHRSTQNDAAPAAVQDAGPPPSEMTAKEMTPSSATNEAANPNSTRDASATARAATGEKPATNEKSETERQQAAGVAGGVSGNTALAQTPDPKPVDQPAAKSEATTQPSAAPAEPAKPQASEVVKDQDKEKAAPKDAKASPSERRADEVAADGIKPPPPPPSRDADSARGRERDEGPASGVPGMRPFTDVSAANAATPSTSLRVGNHLFSFRGGVWTDKEYKPDKDKPVTIIRDSDVYHSLLAKDAKIEPFLKGFPHNARVIFKFKGVVYKLVPQDSDQ